MFYSGSACNMALISRNDNKPEVGNFSFDMASVANFSRLMVFRNSISPGSCIRQA